jgi:DNA-binding NarL/FixJ family response regulator
MIRILIADGQDEVRRGLRMRLDIEPDVAIVGATGQVGEALALAQALAPDVIVVDIGMRGPEGVDLVRRLRAAAPAAAVVVLTLHCDKETRARAREAGAAAFLEKHEGAADLLQTIRQLAAHHMGDAGTGALADQRLSVDQPWNPK